MLDTTSPTQSDTIVRISSVPASVLEWIDTGSASHSVSFPTYEVYVFSSSAEPTYGETVHRSDHSGLSSDSPYLNL